MWAILDLGREFGFDVVAQRVETEAQGDLLQRNLMSLAPSATSQVELAAGLIVGMEALIRWNHPTRGPLQPTDFLPVVEKTSVIVTPRELGARPCMQTDERLA